jgi:hypothetical protein
MTLSAGTDKNAMTTQLDEIANFTRTDILAAESAVQDCAVQYPAATDVDGDGDIDTTDNPNSPFPVYGDGTSGGTTGDEIQDVLCPNAPGHPRLFKGVKGRGFRQFDNTNYVVTYINNTTEGAFIRIRRTSSDPLWTEAISRLDGMFSECKAADVTAADGTCDYGCFYYWFRRNATSTTGTSGDESACPGS